MFLHIATGGHMQRDVTGEPEQWRRVGELVIARRLELGMTQEELGVAATANGAGSRTIVSLLERNRQTTYRRPGLIAVARALGWTDDAFDRALAGDPSVDLLRPPDANVGTGSDQSEVEQLRQEVAELRSEIREGFAALRRRNRDGDDWDDINQDTSGAT